MHDERNDETSRETPPEALVPPEVPVLPEAELPPAPVEPLRPVSTHERVALIDVLRGLALFGILAANIRGFAGPAFAYFSPHRFLTAMHDRLAQAFVDTLIQGKFITIFAFLFGVGFAVQLERASARSGRFGRTYAKRLLLLLLFGLVHGLLIWWGDILLVYALVGLLLLFFRRRADRTLAIWATVSYLIPTLLMLSLFMAIRAGMPPPPMPEPSAAEVARQVATYGDGSWVAIQQQRSSDVVQFNWSFFPVFFTHILALFLAGILAWRRRFFTPSPESLPRYRTAMIAGLTVGLASNLAITVLRWVFDPSPFSAENANLAMALLQTIAAPSLSLGYVCAVVLLFHSAVWQSRIAPFAAVGRTALTNYLLQSILGTLLFYSYGLGFFGKVGPAVLLAVTVVLFALQVLMSNWWMARFRFGPAEWVWRRLTYGGPLPMVRDQAPNPERPRVPNPERSEGSTEPSR